MVTLRFRTRRIAAYVIAIIVVLLLCGELIWTWGLHRQVLPGLIVPLPVFIAIPFLILGSVKRDEERLAANLPLDTSSSNRTAQVVAVIVAILALGVGAYLWASAAI